MALFELADFHAVMLGALVALVVFLAKIVQFRFVSTFVVEPLLLSNCVCARLVLKELAARVGQLEVFLGFVQFPPEPCRGRHVVGVRSRVRLEGFDSLPLQKRNVDVGVQQVGQLTRADAVGHQLLVQTLSLLLTAEYHCEEKGAQVLSDVVV